VRKHRHELFVLPVLLAKLLAARRQIPYLKVIRTLSGVVGDIVGLIALSPIGVARNRKISRIFNALALNKR
jgi:hypothetical protein